MTVEGMLASNFELESELELVRNQKELLLYEVAVLESAPRLESAARRKLGMDEIDWEFVYMIEATGE